MERPRALFCRSVLMPHGWANDVRLTLTDGVIAGIDVGARPEAGDDVVELAIPGLPNVHSHAFQRALAGLAERAGPGSDSFWTWRDIMYRFLSALTPEDVEAIAGLAYAEMLEAGFTRVGEFHYLHHDPSGAAYANLPEMAERLAAAAADTGIGLTLLPCFYAEGGFGQPPTRGQIRFLNDLDRFARLLEASGRVIAGLPDAVLGVAPHSLRAAKPIDIASVVALHPAGPVHIHAAEQVAEVEDCIAHLGMRPVAWLLAAGVDAKWCIIHATHMVSDEIRGLAASGAVACLCPLTEASLGDGIFPGHAFMQAGGMFAVGSDSNIQIDAFAEMRQFEYGQRLLLQKRNVLAEPNQHVGRVLFNAALLGGSTALGVHLGLAVGASADVVALDPNHPSLIGKQGDTVLDALLFSCSRLPITQVWRRGRWVVRDGRHAASTYLRERYGLTLRRLLA